MKKLMIAAAIVCAAALSQAATVNWSVTGLTDTDGKALANGTVYTFCTKGDNKVVRSTLYAALTAATTAAEFNEAFAAYSGKAIASLSGAIETAGQFAVSGADLKTAGIPENTKSTALFSVILGTDPVTDDSAWYITLASGTQTTPAYNTQTAATFSVSGAEAHTFAAVPEPTSGLLLLLGVAGMALRRRRA